VVRVVSLHRDVIVFVSAFWQTTCTAVRSRDGEEGFVIDSPVLPEELEALPEVLEQAGFTPSALIATHGDWDHLLARTAFPDAALGVAESTSARLAAEPGQAQRELRTFDEDHYVADRRPLALAGLQHLPVPGKLELGRALELELHATAGHTRDGLAIFIPAADVLVSGDYLCPVEIPMIEYALDAYADTLRRFEPLLRRAETVVPGHGAPMPREQAQEILAQDIAYVDALPDAELPPGRRTATQKRIHDENLERIR
jgi:glyoxylase-like metal-dependent hydrolase (beta-lactamase superfamily II)